MISEAFIAGLGIGTSFGAAVGVLIGRHAQHNDSFQQGRHAQQIIDGQPSASATEQLEAMRSAYGNPEHGHHGHICASTCYGRLGKQ